LLLEYEFYVVYLLDFRFCCSAVYKLAAIKLNKSFCLLLSLCIMIVSYMTDNKLDNQDGVSHRGKLISVYNHVQVWSPLDLLSSGYRTLSAGALSASMRK
jgi:hypothetical protein